MIITDEFEAHQLILISLIICIKPNPMDNGTTSLQMPITIHPITNNYHRGVPCYGTITLYKPVYVSIAIVHFPDV